MNKILVPALLTILFSGSATYSQNLTEKFQAKQFYSESGDTLNYRIFVPNQPDSTGKYPVVLFLHGAGERGNDNKAQLTWGIWRFVEDSVQQNHPSIVVAPQATKDSYWGNENWRKESTKLMEKPSKALAMVVDMMKEVEKTYPVDSSRLYVTGLSMGGFGTWDLIVRYPDKFAAAVPVCGGGDVTKVHRIADLPIWNFHGTVDNVVPPELSRDMITALRYAGGKPGYSEYPDVGHFSWVPAYREPSLINWLFSQQKATDPR